MAETQAAPLALEQPEQGNASPGPSRPERPRRTRSAGSLSPALGSRSPSIDAKTPARQSTRTSARMSQLSFARKSRVVKGRFAMQTVYESDSEGGTLGGPLFAGPDDLRPSVNPWSARPPSPPYESDSHSTWRSSTFGRYGNSYTLVGSPYPSPTESSFSSPRPDSMMMDMDTDQAALAKAADGLITLFQAGSSSSSSSGHPRERGLWSRSSSFDSSDSGWTPSSISSGTAVADSFHDDTFSYSSGRTASPPLERVSAQERLAVARSRSQPILTTDASLDEWRQFGKLDVHLIVFPQVVTLPVIGTHCMPPHAAEHSQWQAFMDQVFT